LFKRTWQIALALILCLPIARAVQLTLASDVVAVDYTGAAWKARESLITRAKVFVSAPPDISKLDLSVNPGDPKPLKPGAPVECHFADKPVRATTPKFDCRLSNGDIVKVKYGRTPERYGEVAASRLLAAVGFGADHVTMVPTLTCIGCPPFPFQVRAFADWFFAGPLLDALRNEKARRNFHWVSVERKMAGRAIEIEQHEGWDWDELKLVDASKGGATRAEIDALRLMAVFLSHWDNKANNQRLVCENSAAGNDPQAPCRSPLLILQDVGATFGPAKVQHDKWAAAPIWVDEARCVVSFDAMPQTGGKFPPVPISEAGRALLAGKLRQLSESQIRKLFKSAHFPDAEDGTATGDVEAWVKTFQEKVQQIAERPACPGGKVKSQKSEVKSQKYEGLRHNRPHARLHCVHAASPCVSARSSSGGLVGDRRLAGATAGTGVCAGAARQAADDRGDLAGPAACRLAV